MYSSTTRAIKVSVNPVFVEQESDPAKSHYFWAYHVIIENKSLMEIQLLTRYWHITDGRGHVQEVRGEGVVGKKPVMAPSEGFEYASGCPLSTPSGFMQGTFQMIGDDGDMFDVKIPTFSLDIPDRTVILN